jgi:methionyl-tRNA formyltransferase
MRIIYLGTPQFAVPTLKKLIDEPGVDVVACITQPDRPSGRGNKLLPPPVKQTAIEHGIPVMQPEKLARSPEIVEAMRNLKPDLIVMVAFGQILKKEVLNLAPMGVINVHGSLLPKLRGAAPINWAIINGDTVTGVTTMYTEAGVDTGPMLLKAEIPIDKEMSSIDLTEIMSHVGADLLIATIRGIQDGSVKPERQDDSKATLAPILTKQMGKLDFALSAERLHDLIRGLKPWPATTAKFRDSDLKIIETRLCPPSTQVPGRSLQDRPTGSLAISSDGQHLYVVCGESDKNYLELTVVQPPNKNRMKASDWARGQNLSDQDVLQ